jgi:hypothetical protein
MTVSSVPPPSAPPTSSTAAGQNSLLVLAQRKNGVGHGQVTSSINARQSNPPPATNSSGNTGSKVDKLV